MEFLFRVSVGVAGRFCRGRARMDVMELGRSAPLALTLVVPEHQKAYVSSIDQPKAPTCFAKGGNLTATSPEWNDPHSISCSCDQFPIDTTPPYHKTFFLLHLD